MLFSFICCSNDGFKSLLIKSSRFFVARIKCINTLVYGIGRLFIWLKPVIIIHCGN